MMIQWLEDAIRDLEALRAYIAKDKPSAANRIATQILSTVSLLSVSPEIGRVGQISDTRELVIAGTPYIIPYRIKNNVVEILRVLHGAMQWPPEGF